MITINNKKNVMMIFNKKYIFFRLCLIKIFYIIFCTISITHTYAERKIFTFSADSTTANLAEGKEFTILTGNAEVTADDVLITAGEIKLYGDDFQFAEVGGRFKALDLKNDFSLEGDILFYDRQVKLLRAEGNVIMKDNQNDVVVRARFLESKEDGKFMVVQLGVKITKKEELSARSEFLTYYRETEILELSGFPYALWKDDEYSAERISINLDSDEVNLEGKVRGTISTRDEEEDKENTEETEATEENITPQDAETTTDEVISETEEANESIVDVTGTTENIADVTETTENIEQSVTQEEANTELTTTTENSQ